MHMTWNTMQHGLFPHPFENKDIFFCVEVVSDLAYEFCCGVDISVNQILTKYGHLVQWHRDFFGGSFKGKCTVINQNNQVTCCSDTAIVYSGSLKRPSIIKIHKNLGPWCSYNICITSGNFRQLSSVINRNIWNQRVFWVWVGCIFTLNDVRRFIF